MRKILMVVLCCMWLVSYAQTGSNIIPAEIKNTRLSTHVNIPGTRMFVVLPPGFTISKTLPAIEKGEDALVQAMDLVGGNYYSNAATFSRETFEQKGIKVFEYRQLKVNGFPAKMVLLQGDPQMKAYNLVFGDSTFSTSIMGLFKATDTKAGEQVRQALLSIYYDKSKKIDPFASAVFKINDSKSIFKFANFTASVYEYSIGGIKKESYGNNPMIMILTVPFDEQATLKVTADKMAKAVIGGSSKNVSATATNGLQTLRREVYGTVNGKAALLFQHLVVIDKSTVVMQGIAYSDFEKYIPEFEKLFNTVQRK